MEDKYDVVIIGAGIGGLVCGCYLAKAGLKVLIAEQHNKPGGYCTSFERKGYRFDVGVHYIGSLRENGILTKILKELNLNSRIKFIINDPVERIMMPDKTIFINQRHERTKEELIAHFPQEKQNINNFFNFVLSTDFLTLVSKTKKMTFGRLLDLFFSDYKLKNILSVPLVNIGLPPSQASALVVITIYKEYVFDGGYYPKGGIQVLADLLAERFREYGGKLLLSTRVDTIMTKNKKVVGVKLQGGIELFSNLVVSNADATLTFRKLLDCTSKESKICEKLKPSTSAFIIYLGLNRVLNIVPKHYTTCFFSTYDVEKCFSEGHNLVKNMGFNYLLFTFSSIIDETLAPMGKSVLIIFVETNYSKKDDWDFQKIILYEKALIMIPKIIPDFNEKDVEIKEIATPETFLKFTSNRDGALFGWASLPSQIDRKTFQSKTNIENLYLTGHWVTNGVGQSSISLVALCGFNTAELILRREKI